MPIIGWIRDLFGILNDAQAAKKTRLEIEKIEDEKREQLIKPPTLDEIKKYDPNTRRIIENSGGCATLATFCLALFLLMTFMFSYWAR